MNLIQEFLELPQSIKFEGVYFSPVLFPNWNEMRLAYKIDFWNNDSPHKERLDTFGCWENPFLREGGTYSCSFLYLVENITNLAELEDAIEECKEFLIKHFLYKPTNLTIKEIF